MSIDISHFSPEAQAQIRAQLGEPKSKYHARKATRGKMKFPSQKEARRYDELMLMLRAGNIRDLRLQPEYTLQESYRTPEGDLIRAIRYRADFSYEQRCDAIIGPEGGPSWIRHVEDVKSSATKTRVYSIKIKLMREKYGIKVEEI